jgi:hypothetical protein
MVQEKAKIVGSGTEVSSSDIRLDLEVVKTDDE